MTDNPRATRHDRTPPGGTCDTCGQVHERCTAHKSGTIKAGNPRPCMAMPINGLTVCGAHGGKSVAAKAAAGRRVTEAKASRQLADALRDAYGDHVPQVDPADAMLHAVSWKYAEVRALRAYVAELDPTERVWGVTKEKTGGDDAGTTEEARPNIWWQMLRTAEDQLVKYAAAARAAGCDERRVRLAEGQGQLVAGVIRAVLARLNLSDQQRALIGTVVPEELRRLSAPPEGEPV